MFQVTKQHPESENGRDYRGSQCLSKTTDCFFRAGIYKLTWNQTAKLQTGPVAAWRQIMGSDVRAAGASEQALGFKVQTCGSGPAEVSHIPSTLRKRSTEFSKITHITREFPIFTYLLDFLLPRNVKNKKHETQKSPKNPFNSPLIYNKIPSSAAGSVQTCTSLSFHWLCPQTKSINQSSLWNRHSFKAWCKS